MNYKATVPMYTVPMYITGQMPCNMSVSDFNVPATMPHFDESQHNYDACSPGTDADDCNDVGILQHNREMNVNFI